MNTDSPGSGDDPPIAAYPRGSYEWKREKYLAEIREKNKRLKKHNVSLQRQLRAARSGSIDPETGRHRPTDMSRRTVRQLARYAANPYEIARVLGIPLAEFEMLYGSEYQDTLLATKVKVLKNYVGMATNSEHPSSERAGRKFLEVFDPQWKDVKRIETDNLNKSGPRVIDSRDMSIEDRATLREIALKMIEARKQLPSSVVAEQDSDE